MRIGVAGPIDLAPLKDWLVVPELEHIVYSFPLTGHLARHYRLLGHEVSVFAEVIDAPIPGYIAGDGVDVYLVPMRARARDRALDFWRAERDTLYQAMQKSKVDVIHAHWTYEFALAAIKTGIPTLVTVHDWAPAVLRQQTSIYRFIRLLMQARVLRTAPHLTAVSPYIHERTARFTKGQLSLVPNGVDDSWGRIEPNPGKSPIVLAVNSGFASIKNVTTLLQAFARVDDQSAELRLVGSGYEAEGEAARWAHAHGLADRVRFLGPLDHDAIRNLLAEAWLFVHPSLEESFGMAILEAAASGTPVLAHRGALGPAWILSTRRNCLVDCSDSTVLGEAISGLLCEGPKRDEQLRADVNERFGLAGAVSQYLQLLEGLSP